MKPQKMLVGKTYYVLQSDYPWLLKPEILNSELTNIKGFYIGDFGKKEPYFSCGDWGDYNCISSVRLATQVEEAHMEQCIKAGKYVDCKPIKLILHYGLL